MSARYKGSRLEMVANLLRERGPMTATRIAEELDIDTSRVSVTIAAARARRPGKSFRILRYEPQTGRWAADQPVWTSSPGLDAERQPVDKVARTAAYERRYREKNREVLRAKALARSAARKGSPVQCNHYLQLVPVASRGYVAANSQMKRAA